jgi:hypothetical protein
MFKLYKKFQSKSATYLFLSTIFFVGLTLVGVLNWLDKTTGSNYLKMLDRLSPYLAGTITEIRSLIALIFLLLLFPLSFIARNWLPPRWLKGLMRNLIYAPLTSLSITFMFIAGILFGASFIETNYYLAYVYGTIMAVTFSLTIRNFLNQSLILSKAINSKLR